jgi:hypothetical protein
VVVTAQWWLGRGLAARAPRRGAAAAGLPATPCLGRPLEAAVNEVEEAGAGGARSRYRAVASPLLALPLEVEVAVVVRGFAW